MSLWSWLFGKKAEAVCTVPEEPTKAPEVFTPAPPPPVKKVDPYADYRPIFNLLGKSEGTDKGRGYNETLAYGKLTGGPVPLANMTLSEVDALQTKMLKHPDNKWNSSAVGRYQIIRTTLRKLKKQYELSDTITFSENLQDYLCLQLLEGRGLSKFLAGTMSENVFINNLAKEWASIPKTNGKGNYVGQNAGVTVEQVKAAIAQVKQNVKG